MLVLARHHNEAIIVGHGPRKVRVLVVDVRGDKIKLGIEAPSDMPVHREEVHEAIVRQGGDLLQKRVLLESVAESFSAFRELAMRLAPSDEALRHSLAVDLSHLVNWLVFPDEETPTLAERDD
jgi:carbon storage regulator